MMVRVENDGYGSAEEALRVDAEVVDALPRFKRRMQWFLENGDANDGGSAIIGDALTFPQTFSYAGVRNSGDLRVILGLLSADGTVAVLSPPSVLREKRVKLPLSPLPRKRPQTA